MLVSSHGSQNKTQRGVFMFNHFIYTFYACEYHCHLIADIGFCFIFYISCWDIVALWFFYLWNPKAVKALYQFTTRRCIFVSISRNCLHELSILFSCVSSSRLLVLWIVLYFFCLVWSKYIIILANVLNARASLRHRLLLPDLMIHCCYFFLSSIH